MKGFQATLVVFENRRVASLTWPVSLIRPGVVLVRRRQVRSGEMGLMLQDAAVCGQKVGWEMGCEVGVE